MPEASPSINSEAEATLTPFAQILAVPYFWLLKRNFEIFRGAECTEAPPANARRRLFHHHIKTIEAINIDLHIVASLNRAHTGRRA